MIVLMARPTGTNSSGSFNEACKEAAVATTNLVWSPREAAGAPSAAAGLEASAVWTAVDAAAPMPAISCKYAESGEADIASDELGRRPPKTGRPQLRSMVPEDDILASPLACVTAGRDNDRLTAGGAIVLKVAIGDTKSTLVVRRLEGVG